MIGPILTGLARSVHILQLDADVGDVVNLTAIAVIDADRKQRVEAPTDSLRSASASWPVRRGPPPFA